MRRQAAIYSVYAALGIALLVYLLTFSATAWERFGASSTFVVACTLAVLFAALATFHAWVAYLFTHRAVAAISWSAGGALLIPEGTAFAAPVSAEHVRVIRHIGEQFSRNEHTAKFALIQANGRYWVAPAGIEIPAQ